VEGLENQKMIQEIVDFVQRHPQSHASRVVLREALQDYGADVQSRVEELTASLGQLPAGDLEYCYYLIK
jgi:hypothetical protein